MNQVLSLLLGVSRVLELFVIWIPRKTYLYRFFLEIWVWVRWGDDNEEVQFQKKNINNNSKKIESHIFLLIVSNQLSEILHVHVEIRLILVWSRIGVVSKCVNNHYMAGMHNPTAGATASKAKVGSSQPSEASFKRKRGVFQKDCKYIPSNGQENPPLAYLFISIEFCFHPRTWSLHLWAM